MKAPKPFSFLNGAAAMLALLLLSLSASQAVADSGQRGYQFLLGAGALCSLNPSFCPTVAMAPNGDVVEFSGTGTFDLRSKVASGAGTFTHKNAAGSVLASGTWVAVELLSFHSFGSGAAQGLPTNFEGGKALLRVRLSPAGGGALDAIVRVTCDLGDKIPAASEEGIRLNVPGISNFTEEAGGNTLFIRQ
jgi:hypothetical protein